MKNMNFKMQILNIFRLSNGSTIFTGIISKNENVIQPGQCNLLKNGVIQKSIYCTGEQIVKKIDKNNIFRAIATSEEIKLTTEEIQTGEWILEGIE